MSIACWKSKTCKTSSRGSWRNWGAKQGDDILLATIQFPNRVIITLNLMSGQVNYWLEWSAFINDEPLGLLFEPEFELEQKSSIRVGPDEYEIEFTNLI